MMLVLVVCDNNSAWSVAFGVLELNGRVMDFVLGQNVVDALQYRVAGGRRHVFDEYMATQSVGARTQAPDMQIVNVDHAVDGANGVRNFVQFHAARQAFQQYIQ